MFTAKVSQMDYRSGLKQIKKYDLGKDAEEKVSKLEKQKIKANIINRLID